MEPVIVRYKHKDGIMVRERAYQVPSIGETVVIAVKKVPEKRTAPYCISVEGDIQDYLRLNFFIVENIIWDKEIHHGGDHMMQRATLDLHLIRTKIL